MAIVIGIASSTIGFTAWNVTVPLLFIGFGFDPFDAIFTSLMVDFVDSTFLTIRYARNGHVNFRMGLVWSSATIIGVVIGYFFSYELVMNHQNLLRGGISLFTYVLGASFLFKGWRNAKIHPTENFPPEEKESPIRQKINRLPPIMIFLVMAIGMVISGACTGLLGIGSGLNFVLLFLIVYGFDHLKATGTGCMMMAIVTLIGGLFFLHWVHFSILAPYLLIGVTFGLIGTIIGSHFALRIDKHKLNYLVGGTMIVAATIATIQTILFA
jgi:uncharacterized membrane protein YfcA